MPPVKSFGERIADAMMEDGLLTQQQVEELITQQKKDGTRLMKLVLDKGYVSEADLSVSMGRVLNTPPINLPRISIPPDISDLIPKDVAHTHKVLPVLRMGNRLYLAMADPLNVLALDDVKRITKLDISPMIAPEKSILDKLNTKTGSMEDIIQDAEKAAELEADAADIQVTKETEDKINLDALAASSEEAPVIKLANLILVQAIKARASDIPIEPFEKMVRLR